MYKTILIILLFLSIYQISFSQNSIKQNSLYSDTIIELWNLYKPTVENEIILSKYDTYNLYRVQIGTNNLMWYAFNTENYSLLDELLNLYLNAINTLDTTDKYRFIYFYYNEYPTDTIMKLNKKYVMWLDNTDNENPAREDILSSSQFFGLISDAIFRITKISKNKRTDVMKHFVNVFYPILDSHYTRWIKGITVSDITSGDLFFNIGPFQKRGWGCKINNVYIPTNMSHVKLLNCLFTYNCGNINSKKYCNAVLDVDLWIIAGISNLVASHLIDSSLVKHITNLSFY